MFTKDEAIDVLEKSWGMKDVEKQVQEDKTNFLNKLIVLIYEKVPFHTLFIRLFAMIPPNWRKTPPTPKDIREMCVSGNGGNCTTINAFMCGLLNALGYSAFVCPSYVTSTVFNFHLVAIVKDLEKEGDLHLIDCGLGLPAFRAIPLNFPHESPVYQDSFLEYKFMRRGDKILRLHGDGDLVDHSQKSTNPGLDFHVGKWRRFYWFRIDTIKDYTTLVQEHIAFSFGFFSLYIPPRAVRFPGGKTVIINENKLLIENDDHTLETIIMDTKQQILAAYRKYFPMINYDLVVQAIAGWPLQVSKL